QGLSERPRKFQREHFFSKGADDKFKEIFNRTIQKEYEECINDENLYSSAEDKDKDLNYDKWIDNIGNIFLLKADLNLDAKNRSILKKAKKYSEKAEIEGTKCFMKEKVLKLQELLRTDENFFEEELRKNDAKTELVIRAFKLLIDIRHYKILEFFTHRF
uniref:DUF1524 domain-containing protein n=1 Tax=Persephonella sp. TaxID=2060922 RepID=UPI0025E17173